MVYKCEKCGKNFVLKQGLDRHNNRKFSCVPDDNRKFPCTYCDAVFSFRQSRNVHQKYHCKMKPDTYTIKLNNFGDEYLDHLSDEFLTKCVSQGKKGMRNLMNEIFFNDAVPENTNIRFYSVQRKLLEVYIDDKWTVYDQSNVLDDIIRKCYRILFQHMTKLNTQYENTNDPNEDTDELIRQNDSANKYLTNLADKKQNGYYELRRDLYALLVTQRCDNSKQQPSQPN